MHFEMHRISKGCLHSINMSLMDSLTPWVNHFGKARDECQVIVSGLIKPL